MYYRDELFLRSVECYFDVYFPRCFATREINTKITLSWALKHFVTRVPYVDYTIFSPFSVCSRLTPGPRLKIKTFFGYHQWDFHYKDKTVARLFYLYNGNPFTVKTTFLYWDGPPGTLQTIWTTSFNSIATDIIYLTMKYSCDHFNQQRSA